MAKEVPAFSRAEIGDDATDPTQNARDRMLGRLAQMRLEFAEGQFDQVEVRRIFREINECRTRPLDRLGYAGDLVHRQIVHGVARETRADEILEEIYDIAHDSSRDYVKKIRANGKVTWVVDREHIARCRIRNQCPLQDRGAIGAQEVRQRLISDREGQ